MAFEFNSLTDDVFAVSSLLKVFFIFIYVYSSGR